MTRLPDLFAWISCVLLLLTTYPYETLGKPKIKAGDKPKILDSATSNFKAEGEVESKSLVKGPKKLGKSLSTSTADLTSRVLNKINEFRARHSSPEVVLDKALTANSQKWADIIAASGVFNDSCPETGCSPAYGENMAMGPPGPNDDLVEGAIISVQRWYDQWGEYDYKNGQSKGTKVTGSFTELVWKGCKKVGIGASKRKTNGYIYTVVQFLPPGNMLGEYKENVLPPTAKGAEADLKDHQVDPTTGTQEGHSQPMVIDSMDESVQRHNLHNTTELEAKILPIINGLRAKHHSPPLQLDDPLTNSAQTWAEQLAKDKALSTSCKTESCCYGESMASTSPDTDLFEVAKVAVEHWYNESNNYNYRTAKPKTPDALTGAFTALVWKSTTNLEGDFKANVLSPNDNGDIYEIQQVTMAPKKSKEPEHVSDSFQITILALINKLRVKHHVLPVGLDHDMTIASQKITDEMAETGLIKTSCKAANCPYTENNGVSSPRKTINEGGVSVVMTWYAELSNYNFAKGKPKNSMVIKDFTSMVWKGVKKVGIGGTVKKSNGFIYIIVQFAPVANIPGQYLSNVFPEESSPDTAEGADADTATSEQPETLATTSQAEDKDAIITKLPKLVTATTPPPERWQIKVLNRMNELRAKHRSPPLELDEPMTKTAQKWADGIAAAGKLEPSCKSSYCSYGENQGVGPANNDMATGVKVIVNLWYSKNTAYDYQAGKGKNTGSFTAMIWKASKKCGIGGAVKLPDGSIYVVIQFSPPGNIAGSYRSNVQDPKGPSAYEIAGEPPSTNASKERSTHEFLCATTVQCPGTYETAATKPAFAVKQLQQAGLDAINALRKKHKVSAVCLDEHLNNNAMAWAQSLATIGKLDLSCIGNDCCYGEIQAARLPNENTTIEVNTAIQNWYNEIRDYNFVTGLPKVPTKMVTGFTALVWKGSTKVGIGAFVKPSNEVIYVVIQFSPPGNTRGMYKTNVPAAS